MIKTKRVKSNIILTIAITAQVIASCFINPSQARAEDTGWSSVLLNVPFTTQAPLGEWNDPRQKDGCEEASVLMAMMWSRGITLTAEEAREQIIGMSDFEKYFKGSFEDSSAFDTASLMVEYFGYPHGEMTVHYGVSSTDIISALNANHALIVPINPRVMSTTQYNKATTRHTVVVIGYDNVTNEIIFHDPLFSSGAFNRVPVPLFEAAMADYRSGRNLMTRDRPKAMIVVGQY